MTVNKAILVGKLGRDPELRYTKNGYAFCSVGLATDDFQKGKDGKYEKITDWHTVVCWGKTAENLSKYCGKGSSIYVEGRIKTRAWEKNGEKRVSTEVVADKISYLTRKETKKKEVSANAEFFGESEEELIVGSGESTEEEVVVGQQTIAFADDDIPF